MENQRLQIFGTRLREGPAISAM